MWHPTLSNGGNGKSRWRVSALGALSQRPVFAPVALFQPSGTVTRVLCSLETALNTGTQSCFSPLGRNDLKDPTDLGSEARGGPAKSRTQDQCSHGFQFWLTIPDLMTCSLSEAWLQTVKWVHESPFHDCALYLCNARLALLPVDHGAVSEEKAFPILNLLSEKSPFVISPFNSKYLPSTYHVPNSAM